MTRLTYGLLVMGLAALWIALLARPVLTGRPENDLWWMMPLMERETQHRTGLALFSFLLSPAPFLLGQPLLKGYLWLNTSGVGLSIPCLLMLSAGLHAINAFLVYGLSRMLGYSRRIGAIAGVIYLTLFAHFHAYLWPTAVQHLIAVTTILALLNLYLRVELNGRTGVWVAATLALMVFSSLQRSGLLGPLLMGVYTLWGSRSPQERDASFRRWLPGWLLCGIYPSFALASVGDPRITRLFFEWPLPVILKALMLWGSGVAVLWMIRKALGWAWSPEAVRQFRRLMLAGLIVGVIAWALRDKRQWLFLYNAAIPWASITTSFLEPLRTASLIPSTEPYHLIPPQVSAWGLMFAAVLMGVSVATAPERRRMGLLFVAWYGVGLLYFLQPYSSCPMWIPSRYFIYLSPLFAIVFAHVIDSGGHRFLEALKLRPRVRELLVVGAVAALCIPNLVAIRLELFRGRLVNTYLLYEEIRPVPDLFEVALEQGRQAWARQDTQEAEVFFRRAAEIRPFFLRYTLSPYRLEDTRWLTGGMDLRQWTSKMTGVYGSWEEELPDWAPQFRQTADSLQRELSDYLYCLLALSCLEQQKGNRAASDRWLAQIGFIEQDGWRLSRWIREDARVKSNPALQQFAIQLGRPAGLPDPLPWRKDDYGFGLFMTRFLTQWQGGI